MNALKCFAFLSTACLFFGCATPAEMRTKTPVLEVQSKLSPKDVATCIADKWENSGFLGLTVPVHMRQTGTGYAVSIRDAFNTTSLLADVEGSSSDSNTKVFRTLSFGGSDFIDAVKGCQQ